MNNIAKPASSKLRTTCKSAKELTERSNIHGLNHIFPSPSMVWRIIWTGLWLLGIAGLIYNVILLVENFNRKPITTKQTVDFERFKWPDISFCNNMASYSLETTEQQDRWRTYKRRAEAVASQLPLDLFQMIDSNSAEENRQHSLVQATIDPQEFGVGNAYEWLPVIEVNQAGDGIKLVKDDVDEMRVFTIEALPVIVPTLRFKRYHLPCYTLQLSKLETSSIRSEIDTLMIYMAYHHRSYMFMNLSSAERYFSVYINPTDVVSEAEPITLEPGYLTTVTVDMLRTRRETTSKRCRTSPDYAVTLYQADLIQKHRVTGSAALCHQINSQRLYVKHCSCYNPYLPYYELTKEEEQALSNKVPSSSAGRPNLCLNMDVYSPDELAENIECMKDIYLHYSNASAYNTLSWSQECQKIDPLPSCDDITYPTAIIRNVPVLIYNNKTVHQAFIAQMEDLTKLVSQGLNLTEEERQLYLSTNIGLLQVKRTKSHGSLVQEDLQFTVTSLLSDLGGQMGLWLGISVMALFEIIEFFSPLVSLLIAKIKGRRNGKYEEEGEENSGSISEDLSSK